MKNTYKGVDVTDLSSERIVILDASTGKAYVLFVPLGMIEWEADEIMEYFEEALNVKTSDCEYMLVNDIDFIQPIIEVRRTGADAL